MFLSNLKINGLESWHKTFNFATSATFFNLHFFLLLDSLFLMKPIKNHSTVLTVGIKHRYQVVVLCTVQL